MSKEWREVEEKRSGERKGRKNKEGVEGKRGNMKRGESCAKTKTEMGLVTAMVRTAGLALSLGPLSSHPQEAGPLQARRGVAYESGLRGGWACFSNDSGLDGCWTAEDQPCSPGQARSWGRDWGEGCVPPVASDTASQY